MKKKSGKHVNRVENNGPKYTEWAEQREGYDAVSPEGIADCNGMYSVTPLMGPISDAYEKLENLYYAGELKGRQREVVALLFDGVLNQSEIARRLGITQQAIEQILKAITKKLN